LTKKITYLILPLILLLCGELTAQNSWDSKGTDFWLTFIPNFHNSKNSGDPIIRNMDTLNIYIASETPTSGTITYRDISGKTYTHNFTITDTNEIYRFKLHFLGFELEGYNDSGEDWEQHQTEKKAPQSFHIVSDDDITVYALNQAIYTSDAFLVFPTDILGQDYYILSYNGDGYINSWNSRTPSQFAIVAVEDNTTVSISPSTTTFMGRDRPFSIKLNQGDVYLVQGGFDKGEEFPDLTGSIVKANKPIAVFAGHQRSKIPVDERQMSPSRDILIEQMQPFKNWGKNAFIIPLVQPYNITAAGTDLFRIIAAMDNTEIYLNNELITTINEGDYFEAPADKIFVIRSNNPIAVAQYKKTSSFFGSDLNISDPYMLVIPPKEQYLSSYRIINTESWDYNSSIGFYESFSEHYITLIVPDTAINTIKIDGIPLDSKKFKPIPNSGYSYINYPTIAGVHSVDGSTPFGIYISGFGLANSYGYLGGMNFKQLNFRPPRIYHNKDICGKLNGIFTKYSRTDYGIWNVAVTNSNNVNVDITPFNRNDDSVRFSAVLADYRNDGIFTITVSDSLDNTNSETFDIYGFTVGLTDDHIPDTLLIVSRTVRTKITDKGKIHLVNYGQKTQIINRVWFKNDNFKINTPKFFVLVSNQNYEIEYEYYFDSYLKKDTAIVDTLMIADNCFERPIAIIQYTITGDSLAPATEITHTACDTMVAAKFTEIHQRDYGFTDYQIEYNLNCSIVNTKFTENELQFNIYQTDKRLDAAFKINAIDSSGNMQSILDTIDGNQLFIEGISDTNNILSFKKNSVGFLWCDSLIFKNYSPIDLIIYGITIARNIEFSVPQSQFPFIVKPGQKKALFVCFKPSALSDETYRDTLTISMNCVEQKIILSAETETIIRNGTSQCGAGITLVTTKTPANFLIDNIFPNPVNSYGKIRLALPQKAKIKLQIFNLLGQEIIKSKQILIQKGFYDLDFDFSELKNGMYFLVITYKGQKHIKTFVKTGN
jgi:hypothetical protein